MYKFNSYFLFPLFIIFFFTIKTSCYAAESVLIDTDMAIDDWGAILYLLNSKSVNVKGITVSGDGEASCNKISGNLAGAVNALGLIKLANKQHTHIPVACGQSMPTQGNHVFPKRWRINSDTTYGVSLPRSTNELFKGDAVELIISILEQSPKKIKIVAIGPITNIALALQKRPDLTSHVDSITIMGGAVHVLGNLQVPGAPISNNRVAEWNIYIDPHAAQLVFKSGIPIMLISLDGTKDVPITPSFAERLQKSKLTPSAQFLSNCLLKEMDFIKTGKFYFWDGLAAVAITHPSVCDFKLEKLLVTEQEGPESGRTYVDKAHGYPVFICRKANGKLFKDIFLRTINIPSSTCVSGIGTT